MQFVSIEAASSVSQK